MVPELHRFFVVISRTVLHNDGSAGTAPDPLVWSAGSLPQRRWVVQAVRNNAMLPGPDHILGVWLVGVLPIVICAADFLCWLRTVGCWLNWLPFLVLFFGQPQLQILGVGRFHTWKYLFCMSCGLRRLCLGMDGQGVQFQCRLFFSVQALIIFGVPDGLLSACWGALCGFPQDIGRFHHVGLEPIIVGSGVLGRKVWARTYVPAWRCFFGPFSQ